MQPSEPDHLAAKPTCYFDSWESAVDPSSDERPSSGRTLPLYPFDPSDVDPIDSTSPIDPLSSSPLPTPRPQHDTGWHEWCWAPQWEKIGEDPRPGPMQVSHRRLPNEGISTAHSSSLPTTPTAPNTKRRQSSGAKALRVLGVPELTAGTMGPLTPDSPPVPNASMPSTPAPNTQRRRSGDVKALRVLGGPAWLPESIRLLTPENLSRSSTASSRKRQEVENPADKQQAAGDISMVTSKGSQTSANSSSTGKKSVASSKSSIARIFSRTVPDMRLIELIGKGISSLQRGPPQKSLAQSPREELSKHADDKPQPVTVDKRIEQHDKSMQRPAVRPQLSAMKSEKSSSRNRSKERKRPAAVSWSRHSEHHITSSKKRSTPALSSSRSSPGLIHSSRAVLSAAGHHGSHSSTHSHASTPVTILDIRGRPEQCDSASMLPTLAHKRSRPAYLRSLSSMDKLFRSRSSQKSESGASMLSGPGPIPSSQSVTPLETPTSTASSPMLTHTKPHHKQRKSFLRWRWLGFGPMASSPVDLRAQTPISTATPHSQPGGGVVTAKAAEYFDLTDPTVIRTLSKGKDSKSKSRASKRDKAVRRVASDDDFPRRAMRKATTRYHPQREADVYSLSSDKSRHSPPAEAAQTAPATAAAAPARPMMPVTGAKLALPRQPPRQSADPARAPAFLSEAQRVNTPPLPTSRPGKQGKLTGFFMSFAAPGEDPLTTPPARLALRPPLSAPAVPSAPSTSALAEDGAEKEGKEMDYYRVRMERIMNASEDEDASEDGEVEARAGFDWSIPEHLPNSPLCPLSPKFSGGGRGICVYHGRKKG